MPTQRNLRIDLLGLALLGLAGMLLVALVTYDPADDLSAAGATTFGRDLVVWPANDRIANRCGAWGAFTADLLLTALGWSAFLTPALFAIPGLCIVRRLPPALPWMRVVGTFGLVVAGCALLDLMVGLPGPGPVVRGGGRLGAVVAHLLGTQFGHVGGFLATVGLLVTGLVLALDQSVLTALRVAACGARGCTRAIRTVPRGTLLRQFAEGELADRPPRRSVWTELFDEPPGATRAISPDLATDDPHHVDSSGVPATDGGWLTAVGRLLGLTPAPAHRADDDHGSGLRGPLRMQSDLVAPKRRPRSSDEGLTDRHGVTAASRVSPTPAARPGGVTTRRDERHSGMGRSVPSSNQPGVSRALVSPADAWDDEEDDDEGGLAPHGSSGTGRGWSDLDRIPADLTAGDEEEPDDDELEDEAVQPTAPPARREPPPVDPQTAIRESVMEELDEADTHVPARSYVLPGIGLLKPADTIHFAAQEDEVREKAAILERTLGQFGFQVKVVAVETGPVIAQYELKLEAGLRLAKITGLSEDLAIALCVPSVRIVAPLPGKNTVGVEVPNTTRRTVRLREVFEETKADAKKMHIPIFLGKGVAGDAIVLDLAKMPHLLIAGATGTGKSVCLNSIIASILMTRRPDEVRMLLLDPKKVELSPYGTLPHLMHPVVTETREKAEPILAWAVDKMEERYTLLAKAGVRHIASYNQLGEEELMRRLRPADEDEAQTIPRHLPFLVLVLDEFADMMQEDKVKGKEIESHIIRLAQKSRAVGIHLILATQRPTVDVITGLIKSNLPSRISFKVSSRTDSRVILDEQGADKLLGDGDLLFLTPGRNGLTRGQGTYLDDEEIQKLIKFVSQTEPQFVEELMNLRAEGDGHDAGDGKPITLKKRDELYEAAVEVVVQERRGSVSLLQRNLGIGYGRAARLIDYMAEDGIVGVYNGQNAREVLLTPDQWQRMKNGGADPPEPEAPLRIKIGPHQAYHDGGERSGPSGRMRTASPDEDEEDDEREPLATPTGRASYRFDDESEEDDEA